MCTNGLEKYDTVVIGSGVGGLTCAALLAMLKKRVLLLERNDPSRTAFTQRVVDEGSISEVPMAVDIGGCMQTITYKEWGWNLGLQYQAPFSCYLGPIYLKEADIIPLITDPPVRLKPLAEDYQKLRLPDLDSGDTATELDIWSDGTKMRDYLLEKYPSQSAGIRKYWEYIELTDRYTYPIMVTKLLPRTAARFFFPLITKKIAPLIDVNYDKILEELFDDSAEGKAVKTVLNGYWNVLGMPVDTNFLFWTMSDNQLFHGILAPEGGSKALVDGLLGTFRKYGGEMRTGDAGTVANVTVDGLLCKKVTGVTLADGTHIAANSVISTAGLPETIGPTGSKSPVPPPLVSDKWVARSVRKSVKEHISIPSSLILRIGLDLTWDELQQTGVVQKKTYRTMTGKPWEFPADPCKEGWQPDDIMVIFPRFYEGGPGDSSLQTVEVVHITDYQKYFSTFTGLDDPRFKEAEQRIIDTLHAHFTKTFPALAPHVKCMLLTSPLTLTEQIHHRENSMYGIDAYRTIDPVVQSRTGLKGLYLSGEDSFVNGVTIATGVISAAALFIDEILDEIPKQVGRTVLALPTLLTRFIFGDPRLKLPESIRRRLT